MKNVVLLMFAVLLLTWSGCQDVTVGYLLTEEAGYNPDSLVVKSELDTAIVILPNPDWEYYVNMWGEEAKEEGFLTIESWIAYLHANGIYEEIESKGPDVDRVRYDIPWVGSPIEGVDGTAPILVSIKNITSTTGDPEKLWKVLSVRGNGMFELPLYHGVPVGRYVISLNFSNEGYSKDVDNCFTIIVK